MNKLLKYFFTFFILLLVSLQGFGQFRTRPLQRFNRVNRPNAGRRIEMVKESFLSRRLNLTLEEEKLFWPLYRKYIQEQTAVRILKRENNSSSSSDGTQQIDRELGYETQLVNIRKHYRDEFLKVLPPEKVSILYKSEREFNDEVLRQLSERNAPAAE